METIIPKITDITPLCIAFEGKQQLEKEIEKKLKHWNISNTKFLIVRDQDSGDCAIIK
ncbi:hypothetical protein MNB_SUP05-SYMBIONT-4-366 [hydrothermal vent metagenome]|uniref:Uncharacterized protein n=1 Tax=hydrothermal vent metagenome TaxID=652676 RepID=A0A1W1DZK4_9ZZZZ